jgi:hypothetical protein
MAKFIWPSSPTSRYNLPMHVSPFLHSFWYRCTVQLRQSAPTRAMQPAVPFPVNDNSPLPAEHELCLCLWLSVMRSLERLSRSHFPPLVVCLRVYFDK